MGLSPSHPGGDAVPAKRHPNAVGRALTCVTAVAPLAGALHLEKPLHTMPARLSSAHGPHEAAFAAAALC